MECGFQIQRTHWGAVYSDKHCALTSDLMRDENCHRHMCSCCVITEPKDTCVHGVQACDVSTREDETGGIMKIIKTMIINGFERQHGDVCL